MFTGLVEEVGSIHSITKLQNSSRIVINCSKVLQDLRLGDSISTNGVCLTVTKFDDSSFTADVMTETMRKTNLKDLSVKDKVNLERALRVGDRLGGHLVSGHIDGVGTIEGFKKEDIAVWISIKAPQDILKYIVYKGSVAIDGVSLTVAYVDESIFKVSIIPHTKDLTTLLDKNVGDSVNLECDMIGKYVEKLMNFNSSYKPKQDISVDFLKENGFL
ncbi:riboflavin synthase [Alkalithermobacter paradoxus]|uniref:Riboflavin synthase n=1 Tax=Alkalithermobacter paradoxus TaxID=29349 RepID=A0A1V4I5V2_9FIRM|nr:riboflavin synthase [[Clostridium] thermoalcaliphilum]